MFLSKINLTIPERQQEKKKKEKEEKSPATRICIFERVKFSVAILI